METPDHLKIDLEEWKVEYCASLMRFRKTYGGGRGLKLIARLHSEPGKAVRFAKL